jgi:uncharacterized protein YaeQ
MALRSTIYKVELQIADMDRHYYGDHALTVARHPSENDERMMVRLLAFATRAHARLELCKGLSDVDEPDLWRRDLTGAIEEWIEIGQPDERRIVKASRQAGAVWVYPFSAACDLWWRPIAAKLSRLDNVHVLRVAPGDATALASLVSRSMHIQCTIQDGQIAFGTADHDAIHVELTVLK